MAPTSQSGCALLEMRGIAKAFRGVQALDDAQLTVRRGSIHALMGENGAGKSTLIKALAGIYALDAGSIRVEGIIVRPQSPRDAEAQGISTVFQEINLIPTLSVADNILLGRQPLRWGFIRQSECHRRAEAALKRIGLSIDVRKALNQYSLAVQQLVAIARALDVDARLLVLDEPTSSLDEREVASLFEVLRELKRRGLGILLVTHFLDQVYAISDTITVLRNGRWVGEFETASFPRAHLVGAMLGREIHDTPSAAPKTAVETAGEAKPPLLELRGLGKAGMLRAMDLRLRAGEVHGLAGLLGSGRTETAHLIFGVAHPDSGALLWRGVERSPFGSPREAMRHGLAFCSEDRKAEGILPRLSVRENLVLA
ncbi:MAG: sugar ABC transporter ATP-binding protein, partial [Verrucomicrobia bacterium]|nr:sugar ABC transporter ATP-binding protein [Verrucomicrobiota bacterium]